jgi:hypothetical protein
LGVWNYNYDHFIFGLPIETHSLKERPNMWFLLANCAILSQDQRTYRPIPF